MSKFLKLGATALAMALSLTMVAPITANAEVNWTKDDKGNTTWTNEDTKKSLSDKDYNIIGTEEFILESKLKAVTIATNSYNETISLKTTSDVAKYENFKSKNKALKVKVLMTDEFTDTTKAEEKTPDFDFVSKDGKTWGYRNVKDEIITTTDKKQLPKGSDYGSYKIRLYTKKAGTYKVKYKAVLKDGTTVEKSFKVIAKENSSPFKDITFAGKTIHKNDDTKPNADVLWEKGFGPFYTTAKSGKIRVTMNPDFKLKKIEYGVPRVKTVADGSKAWDKDNSSSLTEGKYNWKKVKNGKKIKLTKEDEETWSNDAKRESYYKYNARGTEAVATPIRITYYDKKNKTTSRVEIELVRVLK